MRSLWLLTILSVTALAQPSNKVPEPDARFESLVHQFDYNNKAPLDIREEHREERDGATVIELSYASPGGRRVPVSAAGFAPCALGSTKFVGHHRWSEASSDQEEAMDTRRIGSLTVSFERAAQVCNRSVAALWIESTGWPSDMGHTPSGDACPVAAGSMRPRAAGQAGR